MCRHGHKQLAQDLCTLELHSSGASSGSSHTDGGTLWTLTPAGARKHKWATEHLLPHRTAVCTAGTSWTTAGEGFEIQELRRIKKLFPFSCHFGEMVPLNLRSHFKYSLECHLYGAGAFCPCVLSEHCKIIAQGKK